MGDQSDGGYRSENADIQITDTVWTRGEGRIGVKTQTLES